MSFSRKRVGHHPAVQSADEDHTVRGLGALETNDFGNLLGIVGMHKQGGGALGIAVHHRSKQAPHGLHPQDPAARLSHAE